MGEFTNNANQSFDDRVSKLIKSKYPRPLLSHNKCEANEIDDIPKNVTCDIHGQFNVSSYDMRAIGRGFRVCSTCQECVDIYENEKKSIEEKVRAEDNIIFYQEMLNKKLESSGLSKRHFNKTFDNYNADTEGKQKALAKCKKLVSQIKNKESVGNVIMVGGVGTGKTHLASAILRDLIENEHRVILWTLIEIIRRLKATWSKDSEKTEEEMLTYFATVPLLIIDEVGVQFGSDTEKMFIFDIINGRYENMLPTVIISNLDINGVKELIGERCIDRLREDGGQVVAFDWNSHR